jgi:EpsI family protein
MIVAEQCTRLKASAAAPVAVATGAIALCYAAVGAELIRIWSVNSLYSYGFAVPFISGYIVAARSRQFREAIGAPDYLFGAIAITAAALMFAVGEIGTAVRVQELSLVVMIAGVLLLLFGRESFRRIWFAVAYLALMVPVWTDLISRLQVPSQLFSGRIAVAALHLIGMPAVQEGTFIYLPRITLEVLRACSGVNQLVAIFAITLPAAYLWISGRLRRLAFIVASLIIGYLSNGARIALIGILAQNGVDTTSPRIHLLEGLLIALAGYGFIAILFSLLAKPAWHAVPESRRLEPTFQRQVLPAHRRWSMDAALLGVVLLCGSIGWVIPSTAVELRAGLESLPRNVGAWTCESGWQPADGRSASADGEVRLTYRRTSGERVRLYIGYLRYQRARRGLANALPPLPSGNHSTVSVDLPSVKQLNLVEERSATATAGALFWYDIDGQAVADSLEVKGHVLWNAVTRARTNGAVIAVSWDAPANVDPELARERALDFVRSVVPVLPDYLPSQT